MGYAALCHEIQEHALLRVGKILELALLSFFVLIERGVTGFLTLFSIGETTC